MRIKTSADLLVGALVQVRLEEAAILGEVRYCTRDSGGGFFVGLKIYESFPWSEARTSR